MDAPTKTIRRYGRSPRGTRRFARIPHGRLTTLIFMGALRTNGLTARMVIDRPRNSPTFHAFVGQVLVHRLCRGDVVIIDSLAPYRDGAIGEAMGGVGAELRCLPPIPQT